MIERVLSNIFVEVGVAVVAASAVQVGSYESLRSADCSVGVATVVAGFLWAVAYFTVIGVWNSISYERKRR